MKDRRAPRCRRTCATAGPARAWGPPGFGCGSNAGVRRMDGGERRHTPSALVDEHGATARACERDRPPIPRAIRGIGRWVGVRPFDGIGQNLALGAGTTTDACALRRGTEAKRDPAMPPTDHYRAQ